MNKRIFTYIAFVLITVSSSVKAQIDTLHLSLPESFGKRGNTYAYPVYSLDSLIVSDSIYSGEFTVFQDEPNAVDVLDIDTIGTILSGVASAYYNPATGKVAFAHTQPITGKGVLFYLLIKFRANASYEVQLTLINNLINEGLPFVYVTPGSVRPMDIFIDPKFPPQDRVVGDTIDFTVSGDVTFPVTWAVSDTHIASIDANGKLVGKNVGQIKVSVTDAQGLFDESNLLPIHPQTLRSLTVTVPDTSIMQNLVFDYPIRISDVTSLGITSAQFTLSFSQSILIPQAVIINGSMTQTWSSPAVNIGSGTINVALAGTDTLTGSGTLVYVRFKVARFASFSTNVNLVNVLFNENLNAASVNGFFTPIFGPAITITGLPFNIIRNETANLFAGGGTAPYTWHILSDTNVAVIDLNSGALQTKKSGFLKLAAIDVNGFDKAESLFVSDARIAFPDTSFFYTDSIDIPISVTDLSGLSVLSAQMQFSYDSTKLKLLQVMQSGTLSNGMTMEYRDSSGHVAIGMSGTTELSGSGLLLKLRFKSTGALAVGFTQSLGAGKILFNETVSVSQASGNVTILSKGNTPPVFTSKLTNTTITENQLFTYQLKATDADGDSLIFGLYNTPQGMAFNPKTGVINWTPTFAQSGIYNIKYDVGDYHPDGVVKDSAIITVVNVNRAPVFTNAMRDTVAQPGTMFQFPYRAGDPDSTIVTFSLIDSPQDAAITPGGDFTWPVPANQTATMRIIVQASDGLIAIRDTAFISMKQSGGSPLFTKVLPDTTVAEGQTLLFTYQASDPDGDILTWSSQSIPSAVPPISSSGLLSWTPSFTQSGVYIFIVHVSDKTITTVDTAVITVKNTNRAPAFSAQLSDTTLSVDSLFTFTYEGNDPDNDSVSFTPIKIPADALITSKGNLSWIPSQVKKDTFIISLSDGSLSVHDTAFVTVTGFPKLQASAFELDFGTTIFGSLPKKEITIKNTGVVPLVLDRVQGLPGENNFTTDALQQITLNVQEEKIISFTYTPANIGSHIGGTAFQTNDPKQPYLGILLKGTAISKSTLKKKILVDAAHASTVALRDSFDGMTKLFSALKSSGISIAFAETSLTPAGYDAVLIVDPQKEYSPAERTVLREFVKNGGLAVFMGNENNPLGSNTVINTILSDTAWITGLSLENNLVLDSTNNYMMTPRYPLVTHFADTLHPYLRSIDSLVLFGSSSVIVTGKGIPFARFTAPSTSVAGNVTQAAIGLSEIGKGKVVAIGDATLWQNGITLHAEESFNIDAQDNLTFALNIFSVTEDYQVKLPAPTPNERYQLVSIPFDLDNSDIASVLKDLGGVNPLVWRLFGHYNPAPGKYAEFPSAGFNTFARGEAYWLITRGQFNVNFGSATITPAQDFFPITIGKGYSMIGNPFPYKVSWKNSRKGDSVQTVAWTYNGTSFVPESLVLEPFTGYFVKNLSHDSVTIYINPMDVSTSSLPKNEFAQSFGENEWRVSFKARSGKGSDEINIAGVSQSAKKEFDVFDVSEPPATPTDYVVVRFNNSQWKTNAGSYAVDIRPINKNGEYWDFDVTTAKQQSKVSMSFESLGNLPSDFEIYLIDKHSEVAHRIMRTGEYEYAMGKNEARRAFRLVVGKNTFIEQNTNGIPLVPQHFVLQQNYPNPFNPTTLIQYTLGHSGEVSVGIYNILGQKVRTLTNEFQSIGTYTVDWDGKDEKGSIVASGIYFYKITVMSNGERLFAQTKKMVLMK